MSPWLIAVALSTTLQQAAPQAPAATPDAAVAAPAQEAPPAPAGPPAAAPPPATEKVAATEAVPAPADVVDRFYNSLVEGYHEMALAQLTPDVVIYETGFETHGRDLYGLGQVKEDSVFAAGAPRKLVRREQWQAGDAAWVLSQYKIRGDFGDHHVALDQAETVVLRKTDEGWRIAHIHWSAHTPDQE